MFDAIFDATASDAAARWSTVQSNLQIMANLGSSSPDIYVACDDAPFYATNPVRISHCRITTVLHVVEAHRGSLKCRKGCKYRSDRLSYRRLERRVRHVLTISLIASERRSELYESSQQQSNQQSKWFYDLFDVSQRQLPDRLSMACRRDRIHLPMSANKRW